MAQNKRQWLAQICWTNLGFPAWILMFISSWVNSGETWLRNHNCKRLKVSGKKIKVLVLEQNSCESGYFFNLKQLQIQEDLYSHYGIIYLWHLSNFWFRFPFYLSSKVWPLLCHLLETTTWFIFWKLQLIVLALKQT